MKKRVADIIMDTLADNGVEQAFCVVGGGAMHLDNALGITKRIHTVFNHHEQACAMAAEGYARFTENKPALVCVTSGPGGTNTLTGVMGAYVDSVPLIIISGQVRYDTSVPHCGLPLRRRGEQEFDIVHTVQHMTKYANMVTDPLSIRQEVQKAYDIAMHGRRGPVWLDIPLNVQSAEVEEADLYPNLPPPAAVCAAADAVRAVIDKLRQAKRPVVLAGAGIRTSGNQKAFLQFLSAYRIPVVSSTSHPDTLYTEHPLYVGPVGMSGSRAGNFVLQNADVVLVLGSSLSFRETGWVQENFAPHAHLIMVDIDAAEAAKPGLRIGTFVHTDLRCFFEQTLNASVAAPEPWLHYALKVKTMFDPFEGAEHTADGRVNSVLFWKKYAQKAPADAITCLGNSSSICGWLRHGNRTALQRSIVNVNCGSMGHALPSAEGVALAARRQVVMQTGDGCFMMNLQELATIQRNNLPIKLVVFSNGGYNALRLTYERYFAGVKTGCDYDSGLSFPNFEQLAKAFSFPYYYCGSNAELDAALDWLLSQPGYALLECAQTLGPLGAPGVVSRLREDGSSEPALLQDMAPFLDRSVYDELMISTKQNDK